MQIAIFGTDQTSLPQWASDWCLAARKRDPRTRRPYSVPWFRLLYKVHKSALGFRGVTCNHTWVTQPFALLLAFFMLAYVLRTATYMRDSDQFVAELRKIKVGPDDFLVTFDVVRLYPSIPHKLCI